ncbi:MAG: hypothetical protein ACREA5_05340 [Nitrosotalea sp.]
MSNKIALLLLTVSVIMTSVLATSLPQANALIQRDFSILNDTPTTASHGISKVCGIHICAAGEHAQWINTMWQSQRAGKIVSTTTGQSVMNNMNSMNNMTTSTMNGTK